MATPIYVNLDYEQYKRFEEQFKDGCNPLETTHSRDDAQYYHKAIRFQMGDLTWEVTGPGVMAPRQQAPISMAETEDIASEGPVGSINPPNFARSQEGSDQ